MVTFYLCVKFCSIKLIIMDSGLKSLKLISNLFRNRMVSTYGLVELYRPSVYKGKLIELIKEKAATASQSTVAKKLQVLKGYYTLEMAPPTSAQEWAKLKADIFLAKEFFKSGCFKYLTVKQSWLLILVCTEVYLWFFLGETIGKMHLVGYKC